MPRKSIVQLMLPWFGNHDGELYYSPLSLTFPEKADKRRTFRIVRKWYKEEIGVSVPKYLLEDIWKRRHQTFAIDPKVMENYVHNMARETYEETKNDTDSGVQEETPDTAGL